MSPSNSGALPDNMSNPARRALEAAGITNLKKLSKLTEAEVLGLHGVGPKSIPTLTQALAASGLAFAPKNPKPPGRSR